METSGGMLERRGKRKRQTGKGEGRAGGGGGGGGVEGLGDELSAVDTLTPLLNIGDVCQALAEFLAPVLGAARSTEVDDARSDGPRGESASLDQDLAVAGHLIRGLCLAAETRGMAAIRPLLQRGTVLAQLLAGAWPALDATNSTLAFFGEQVSRYMLLRLQLSRAASHEGRPPMVMGSYRSPSPVPVEYTSCHRRLQDQLRRIEPRATKKSSAEEGGSAASVDDSTVPWISNGRAMRSFSAMSY